MNTRKLGHQPAGVLTAIGLALMLAISGCATTVESTPQAAKEIEAGGPPPASVTGFLGPDAAKLAPGPKGGAALVWINPNANWSSYTKIKLMPVEFWAAADSKVSPEDQKVLTTYFSTPSRPTWPRVSPSRISRVRES